MRYIDADALKTDILKKYRGNWEIPCSSEDRLIQRVVTDLRVLIEQSITADVAPKSEVEEWVDKCREWHKVAELKSQCIMELDEGLAKANAEIGRLHGILLQFTDIVHKWGARNGIDTSEISLVPILQKEADGIIGKMEQEIETLKDNNEHLAVLLEEAKDEANRYKRYYFHHDYDKMIDEGKADVARGIFEEIRKRAYSERGFFVVNSDIDDFIAELKKKYTEETI